MDSKLAVTIHAEKAITAIDHSHRAGMGTDTITLHTYFSNTMKTCLLLNSFLDNSLSFTVLTTRAVVLLSSLTTRTELADWQLQSVRMPTRHVDTWIHRHDRQSNAARHTHTQVSQQKTRRDAVDLLSRSSTWASETGWILISTPVIRKNSF